MRHKTVMKYNDHDDDMVIEAEIEQSWNLITINIMNTWHIRHNGQRILFMVFDLSHTVKDFQQSSDHKGLFPSKFLRHI